MKRRPGGIKGRLALGLAVLAIGANGCLIGHLIKSPRSLCKGCAAQTYGLGLWSGKIEQQERPVGPGPVPAMDYYNNNPFGTVTEVPINLWTGFYELRMGSQIPGMELGMGYDYASTAISGDLKYQFAGFADPKSIAAAVDAEIYINTVGAWGFDASLIGGAKAGFVDTLLGARIGHLGNNPYGQKSGYAYYDTGSYSANTAYLMPASYNYLDVFGAFEFEVLEKTDLQLGLTWRTMLDQPYLYPGRDVTLSSYPYTVVNTTQFETKFPSLLMFTVAMRFSTAPRIPAEQQQIWGGGTHSLPPPTGSLDPAGSTHLMAGKGYLREKRWDQAVEEFIQAEAMLPMSSDLALGLGYAYYMKADWASSLYYYEAARSFQPANVQLHQTIIRLKQKTQAPPGP